MRIASIALCKCKNPSNLFGIRLEKNGSEWVYTWAFPVKESAAKREGYDTNSINGSIFPSPEYPGCPFCGTKSYYICGTCGHLNCWDAESRNVTCNWCHVNNNIIGTATQLKMSPNF